MSVTRRRRTVPLLVAGGLLLCVAAAALWVMTSGGSAEIVLRADIDADGLVDDVGATGDAAGESGGVIVLPNLDDDEGRCASKASREDGLVVETDELVSCNDASDDESNGEADIGDITPIEVETRGSFEASAEPEVHVEGAPDGKLKVLVWRGDRFVSIEHQPLTVAELESGVRLGVEATDIVRDRSSWDGSAELVVAVADEGEVVDRASVRLRVAPLMLQHDLGSAETLFVSPPTDTEATSIRGETDEADEIDREVSEAFVAAIGSEAERVGTRVQSLVDTEGDIWVQDYFEPGFVARPTPDGTQVIRIMVRSANLGAGVGDMVLDGEEGGAAGEAEEEFLTGLSDERWAELEAMSENEFFEWMKQNAPAEVAALYTNDLDYPEDLDVEDLGLRHAGVALYTEVRGPDVGVVQVDLDDLKATDVDDEAEADDDGALMDNDTYNSTGNFTTTPPFSTSSRSFPQGRVIYGGEPSSPFLELIQAQGRQDPVRIDTTWLAVGHVDEVISFLPASNDRGWIVAVADPELAYEVLEQAAADGGGGTPVFNRNPEFRRSLDDVLADSDLRTANQTASAAIDGIIETLTTELGLAPTDIVRVPVLFGDDLAKSGDELGDPIEGTGPDEEYESLGLGAYFPNAVNGQHLGDGVFLAPRQHGPQVDGVDALEGGVEAALAPHGIHVRWIDDLEYAHLGGGEIHCVTNVHRDLTDVASWWTTPEQT